MNTDGVKMELKMESDHKMLLIGGIVFFIFMIVVASSIAIPLIDDTLELEREHIEKLDEVATCEEMEFRLAISSPNEKRPVLAELYQSLIGDKTPTMMKAYNERLVELNCEENE